MTSFTRKLYHIDPNAAHKLRRQNYLDYRYGKNVTLAQFTPEAAFGKREVAPVLPAYECWAPVTDDNFRNGRPPKVIVRASNSFEARKEYARHYQIAVTEVAVSKR